MKIERSTDPYLFLSNEEKKEVSQAIKEAERQTSGEIRLHLERKIEGEIFEHGKEIFEKIGMTKTKERNGVLILIGVKSRRFIILGDQGINDLVGDDFWNAIVQLMVTYFKEDEFATGLVEGIKMIGTQLKEFFPYQRDDINELPDEISYSL